ncbi:MAG TPA: D-alanyl-D-alanine carboxypeptidase family protein, partial [Gammaproteobacteria bacterium]|nr:D-alanyl-D-alanine carboxypeptidase family protein [Gammaproteobacteria bacterium]
ALSIIFFSCLCQSMAFARVPSPPQTNAKSYILVDFHSGQILASQNEHEKMDLASLTKIMTVYVVDQELEAGRIKMGDMVHISDTAWRAQGSRMFVEVNTDVSVQDLIRGVIIQSGNDASIALAEHVAGSEESFVNLMNQTAQRLGMKNTHFTNATGLPHPEHYSTAYDISLLARATIHDFPESYKLHAEKWFTYQDIKQPNRNRLLWRENFVDGIKTGFSSTAGYCLAASGLQNGMRLISVVLGAESDGARTDFSQSLLRYGFRFFETHQLFNANKPIKEAKVWMGKSQKLPLGITGDVYITVPQGEYEKLNAQVSIDKKLHAPIKKGEIKGKLTVKLENKLLIEKSLVSLQSVEAGGMWSRFSDYISLKIHDWFKSEA